MYINFLGLDPLDYCLSQPIDSNLMNADVFSVFSLENSGGEHYILIIGLNRFQFIIYLRRNVIF